MKIGRGRGNQIQGRRPAALDGLDHFRHDQHAHQQGQEGEAAHQCRNVEGEAGGSRDGRHAHHGEQHAQAAGQHAAGNGFARHGADDGEGEDQQECFFDGAGLAGPGQGMPILRRQEGGGSPRCVDQDGRNGPAIDAGLVDRQQHGDADDRIDVKSQRQDDGDGHDAGNPRNGAEENPDAHAHDDGGDGTGREDRARAPDEVMQDVSHASPLQDRDQTGRKTRRKARLPESITSGVMMDTASMGHHFRAPSSRPIASMATGVATTKPTSGMASQ